MEPKQVLTKVKTQVSTRTMLLVALGLIIIGGAAFGLAATIQNLTQPQILPVKTTFNVSQASIYTGVPWYSLPYSTPYSPKAGQQLVSSVVYSGQDGSGNAAVPAICQRLKDKGVIKYDIDFGKSKAVGIIQGYCPKRGYINYQAYSAKSAQFFSGSCWGGNDIWMYSQVDCAVMPPYIPPYTPPYIQPYTPPYSAPYSSNVIADYDYKLISQAPYQATMKAGSTQTVSMVIMNTGKKPWYSYGSTVVRLGTGSVYGSAYQQHDYYSEFYNNSWPSQNRAANLLNILVPTGSSTTFQFSIKAPMNPGVYTVYFTPVVDGIGSTWMRDVGTSWRINVSR